MARNDYSLIQTMRWYGPNDAVSLIDIRQAGCNGVVSALHHIPVGDVWTREEISEYKALINSAELDWKVVESLPVHESIKMRDRRCADFIGNYQQSLRNLAAEGIEVVTYNFMPLLDWVRTDISLRRPDGSETLFFKQMDFIVFDLFMLDRPGAKDQYSDLEIKAAEDYYSNLSEAYKSKLFQTVLLGLPGSEVPFTAGAVLELLEQYGNISRQQLKDHLIGFLQEVVPVATEVGVRLAIHPDDPPFSVLGLPRVMCTSEDIEDIVSAVPEESNGLCFCTGSFGAHPDNNIPEMLRKYGSRVHFLHLRNTSRDTEGNFMESEHLKGDTDMYAVMCEIVKITEEEGRRIPVRPDHGFRMLDDLSKKTYPGYSAIGRLKGLAELRGLEYAVRRQYISTHNQ